MPRRIVKVRLWEITAAFVLVTTAFVIQGVILKHQINKTNDVVRDQHRASLARVSERKRTDRRICAKVDRVDRALLRIVAASPPAPRPGWYGYDYWVHHPQEKIGRPGSSSPAQVRAAQGTLAELRAAACDPDNLTKGQSP